MRKLKLCLISLFSIFIFLPAIFFNFKPNYVSEIDNRKLTEMPNFKKINSETLKQLHNYVNDRFWGREYIIDYYTYLMDNIFNELVHPSYIYGKDGYVFFYIDNEKKYTDYNNKFLWSILKIKNYVENNGSKFYMMINPEKKSVYTQYIPSGVNYNRKWIEIFEEKLKNEGINYIDNTQLLKEKSKYEFVYDKKYDAGHWNDLGAFYGVNNLLKNINKDFSTVYELKLSDFDISKEIQTKLKVSNFKIYDESPLFILKNLDNYEDLTKNYINNITLDNNYTTFSYTKNNSLNSETLPKALVFQGSYLNGREKFLKSRFREYIAIHNYQNIFNIEEYYKMFKPDIVIFEVAEYTFNEIYFSEEKMKNLNLN